MLRTEPVVFSIGVTIMIVVGGIGLGALARHFPLGLSPLFVRRFVGDDVDAAFKVEAQPRDESRPPVALKLSLQKLSLGNRSWSRLCRLLSRPPSIRTCPLDQVTQATHAHRLALMVVKLA